MERLIKYVFVVIGTMLISLVIFYLVFGAPNRLIMWNGLHDSMVNVWRNSLGYLTESEASNFYSGATNISTRSIAYDLIWDDTEALN